MFGKQTSPRYANVAASLALFIALGGTATAAVTLPRDSVGSPQIRKAAVRSAEIRDSDVKLADISDGARQALQGTQGPAGPAGPQGPAGPVNVRIAELDFAEPQPCPGSDLHGCSDMLKLSLGSPAPDDARNWLVQAKFAASTPDDTAHGIRQTCGLVQAVNQSSSAITDDVNIGDLPSHGSEVVALSGVVPARMRNPVMAVRCNLQSGDEIALEDITITAIEATTLTGP